MGTLGVALKEAGVVWPPSGLPMGQFRVSPYRCLTGKGPLRYVEYTVDIPGVVDVPDGCVFSSSCFTCSLPDCCYSSKSKVMKLRRNKEMARLRQEGYSLKELASRFDLHRNVISRIMSKAKKEALHVNGG
ncbi:hypothetical protein LCGC14_1800830 [marine sediment metagenome]|uniref:Uncharacterized protein n=1 Tax=marine sediment metagenome TaxID=412755 RepID=A0A0F9J4I2_9ZZZZ